MTTSPLAPSPGRVLPNSIRSKMTGTTSPPRTETSPEMSPTASPKASSVHLSDKSNSRFSLEDSRITPAASPNSAERFYQYLSSANCADDSTDLADQKDASSKTSISYANVTAANQRHSDASSSAGPGQACSLQLNSLLRNSLSAGYGVIGEQPAALQSHLTSVHSSGGRRYTAPSRFSGFNGFLPPTTSSASGSALLAEIPESLQHADDSLDPTLSAKAMSFHWSLDQHNFYSNQSNYIPSGSSFKKQTPFARASGPVASNSSVQIDKYIANMPAGVLNHSLTCYLVQFTSGRTDTYYIPHENNLVVNIGDYVIVEADRGEDLGRVIMDNINVPLPRRNSVSAMYNNCRDVSPTFEMEEQMSSMPGQNPQTPSSSNFPKKIYRVAQPIEVESLLGKVRDEINAISVGQYKVQEWKLPMAIIDAEYQWDRRKLTFFFSVTLPQFYPNQPSPRIDFRTLVRDLYQIYRTRIWMYCVDKDKNRTSRAHNREKFLKQLYKDTQRSNPSPNGLNGMGPIGSGLRTSPIAAITNGDSNVSSASKANGSRVVDGDEWDMSEVFGASMADATVDVEDLTFGMAGVNLRRDPGNKGMDEVRKPVPTSLQYLNNAQSIWANAGNPNTVSMGANYGAMSGMNSGVYNYGNVRPHGMPESVVRKTLPVGMTIGLSPTTTVGPAIASLGGNNGVAGNNINNGATSYRAESIASTAATTSASS